MTILSAARTASAAATIALIATAQLTAQAPKRLQVPDDIGASLMQQRSSAQLETLDQFGVFHFFRFQDRVDDSGIRFRHRIVDDAGRDYKMVHYDHGNGLTAADIDGDGLMDLYFTSQAGDNELWRNLGGRPLRGDATEHSGVGPSRSASA